MPRCDDCTNKRSILVDGNNTAVEGSGSPSDPYKVNVDIGGAGGTRIPGEIMTYGGASAPAGWLLCNGQAVSRATYASLFGVVGTVYGVGDGSSTFNVPDLSGRFPFGFDGSHALGSISGQEEITLTVGNLPAHTHTIAHTHAMDHYHDMSHTHDMSHGHGSTSSGGNHHHTVKQSNNTGTNNTTLARGSQNDRDVDTTSDGAHTHTIPNFAGSTGGDSRGGGTSADSRGGITGAPSAPDSGSVGSSTPHTNMPPYTAVTFLIKT
jgi:microcystin-dependent protein